VRPEVMQIWKDLEVLVSPVGNSDSLRKMVRESKPPKIPFLGTTTTTTTEGSELSFVSIFSSLFSISSSRMCLPLMSRPIHLANRDLLHHHRLLLFFFLLFFFIFVLFSYSSPSSSFSVFFLTDRTISERHQCDP
jgi:hypothetical protein